MEQHEGEKSDDRNRSHACDRDNHCRVCLRSFCLHTKDGQRAHQYRERSQKGNPPLEQWGGRIVYHLDARHIECVFCHRPAHRMSRAEMWEDYDRNWEKAAKKTRGRPRVVRPYGPVRGERMYRCGRCGYVTRTFPDSPRLKRSPNGVRRCEQCRRVPKGKLLGKLHKNGLCDRCNSIKQQRRRVLKCRRQRLRKRLALAHKRWLATRRSEPS
jgi:hypothetical protein